MSFPAYPTYRPSGIAWCSKLPRHWSTRRLKTLFRLMRRPTADGDKIVTAFRDGQVTLRERRREEGFTNALQEIGYQGVRAGDLVIHAMDGFAGAIGVSDADGKSTPVYSVCTPGPDAHSRYFALLLRHMALSGYITALARGIRERSTDFRWSDAGVLALPCPPLAEQRAIIEFLDRETAKIDALVEEQRRLINFLKEKRQAIIAHAVTNGLNPAVPKVESHAEWLGEVPAHWKIVPLKRLVSFQRGHDLPSHDRMEGSIPIVSSGGHIGWHSRPMAHGPSIVTGRYGTIGNFLLVQGPFWPLNTTLYSTALHGDSKFVVYTLENLAPLFLVNAGKSAVPGVDRNDLHELLVAVPPEDEQIEIAAFLDNLGNRHANLSREAEGAIRLLSERKAALISAAVTGRIDVRGAAASPRAEAA